MTTDGKDRDLGTGTYKKLNKKEKSNKIVYISHSNSDLTFICSKYDIPLKHLVCHTSAL